MLRQVVSYIIMVALSFSTVVWNVEAFSQTLAGATQIYKYAKSGNITALRSIKAQGQSLDAVDQYGNTALCRSVWMKDYYTFSILKQNGASVSNPCISKIPAEKVQEFNASYTQWAKGVNAGKIAYGSSSAKAISAKSVSKPATTHAPRALVAEEAGLSVGAKVAIGVGVAAVVGGGIALAAGGGGGSSSGSDDVTCAENEIKWGNQCYEKLTCGLNQHQEANICVCDSGYTMFGDACYRTLDCGANGHQSLDTCICDTGYTGSTCSECDSGYGHYGTSQCYATLNCVNGTQQGASCVCSGNWSGSLCDACNISGADENCSCPLGTHVEGGMCVKDVTSCPTGQYLSEGACHSCPTHSTSPGGSGGIESCVCDEGYKMDDGVCVAESPLSCPNNCSEHGTCDTQTGMCSCNSGWSGADCSLPDSGGVPQQNCGSHGVFNANMRKCVCSDGYSGIHCQIPPCQGGGCSFARIVGTATPDEGSQDRVILLSDNQSLEHKDELVVENIGTMNDTPYWLQPAGKSVPISQWIGSYGGVEDLQVLGTALGWVGMSNNWENVAIGDTGYFLYDLYTSNSADDLLRVGIKAQNGSFLGNASLDLAHSISKGDIEAPTINYLNSGTVSLGSNTVGMVALNHAVVLNDGIIQTIRGKADLDGYSWDKSFESVTDLPPRVQDILKNPNHEDYDFARVACNSSSISLSLEPSLCGFSDAYEANRVYMEVIKSPDFPAFLVKSGFLGTGVEIVGDAYRFNAGMIAGENSIAINKKDIIMRDMSDISSSADLESVGMYGDTGSVLLNEGNIIMESSPLTPKPSPDVTEYDEIGEEVDVAMTGMGGSSWNDQRVYLENTGTISLTHNQDYWNSLDGMAATGFLSTMINNGDIKLSLSGDQLNDGYGMFLEDHLGEHLIENNGNITVIGGNVGIAVEGDTDRNNLHLKLAGFQKPDNLTSHVTITNTGKIQVEGGTSSSIWGNNSGIFVGGVFDNIDIVNQGQIEGVGVDSGILVDLHNEDEEDTQESVLNLTNTGSILTKAGNDKSIISGIYLSGDSRSVFHITNSGTISVEDNFSDEKPNNKSVGVYLTQLVSVGDAEAKEFTLINEASGNIEGKDFSVLVGDDLILSEERALAVNIKNSGILSGAVYIDANNINITNEADGRIDGNIDVYTGTATITNNGTINGNIWGHAVDTTLTVVNTGTVNGFIWADVVNNSGTIVSSGFGIYAKEINNSGTIVVDGDAREGEDVFDDFEKYGEEECARRAAAGNPCKKTSHVLTDEMPSIITMANNAKMVGENLSGLIGAGADITTHDFEDEYVSEKAFEGKDSGINLISKSALFDASLNSTSETTHDIVMTRKAFADVIDDNKIADFLENNYALKNNEDLFNTLKAASTKEALLNAWNRSSGTDTLTNFAYEDFAVLRSLSRTMNDALFAKKGENRSIVGYDHLYQHRDSKSGLTGYKSNADSSYGLTDKMFGDFRFGLGLGVTRYSSDYRNDSDRTETLYQAFMPIGYEKGGFRLVSIPRFGYGNGHYTRSLDSQSAKGKTEKWLYGITNEVRYPIEIAGLMIEPAVEFNILGWHTKGHTENESSIRAVFKSDNLTSVEAGVGLYVSKDMSVGRLSKLKFKVGGAYYHEMAEPYKQEMGIEGMSGSYELEDWTLGRNRGLVSGEIGYDYKNIGLYAKFTQFIENDTRFNMNAGVRLAF